MRTIRYTRRYFLISRLIRYASYIIAAIETSAVLIVLFSALIILMPIALILFGITVLLSTTQYKRYNRLICDDIGSGRIVVIDAKKGYFRKKQHYLNNMARCFRNEGYTVIVVSRSFKKDRFLVAKKAEENIWVVKLNYFFILKKRLKTDNMIFIY